MMTQQRWPVSPPSPHCHEGSFDACGAREPAQGHVSSRLPCGDLAVTGSH